MRPPRWLFGALVLACTPAEVVAPAPARGPAMVPLAPQPTPPAPRPSTAPLSMDSAGGDCTIEEPRVVFEAPSDVTGVRVQLDDAGGLLAVVHGEGATVLPLDASGRPRSPPIELETRSPPRSIVRVLRYEPDLLAVAVRARHHVDLFAVNAEGALRAAPHHVQLEGVDYDEDDSLEVVAHRFQDELLLVEYSVRTPWFGIWRLELGEEGFTRTRDFRGPAWSHHWADRFIGQRFAAGEDSFAIVALGRSRDFPNGSPMISVDCARPFVVADPWTEILRSIAMVEDEPLFLVQRGEELYVDRRDDRWMGLESGEPWRVDAEHLPPPFDDELRLQLDVIDGAVLLSRLSAIGERVGPDLPIGTISRGRHSLERAEVTWTGHAIFAVMAEGPRVVARTIRCASPR